MLDGLSVVVEDMMELLFSCAVAGGVCDCNVFLRLVLYVYSGQYD